MGDRILVTGSDGFIGSHLTGSLVRQGHDVRAFVLYNSFNSWGWLPTVVARTSRASSMSSLVISVIRMACVQL